MNKASSYVENGCNLCPNGCNAHRADGELGVCGLPSDIYVAHFQLHLWEEPVISGSRGSGTIFFSGCTMRCVFCQNYLISRSTCGEKYSVEQLADLFKKLEADGAHNINLVSATPYADKIVEALSIYRPSVPIVWNSSGYETLDTLKLIDGFVDVYLPDLKYTDTTLAAQLSRSPKYFDYALPAIAEMIRQTGKPLIQDGLIKRGVIIRHLIIPAHLDNSLAVLKVVAEKFKDECLFSLMSQYTPFNVENIPEINRPLKPIEYKRILIEAERLNITEGFMQELSSSSENYVPPFKPTIPN